MNQPNAQAHSPFCCADCFANSEVRDFVTARATIGDCSYCGSSGQCVVPIHALTKLFAPLLGQYRIAATDEPALGESALPRIIPGSLPNLIAGWNVFARNSQAASDALLDDLVNCNLAAKDRLDIHAMWVTSFGLWIYQGPSWEWNAFCHDIKYRTRYFTSGNVTVGSGQLARLLTTQRLQRIAVTEVQLHAYRARRGSFFSHDANAVARDMGAPPPEKAPTGRANSVGIPVLYCALDPVTAVAETRGSRGDKITTVELIADAPLNLIDFTNFDRLRGGSPFTATSAIALYERTEFAETLSLIGRQMSEPVNTDDAMIDYIPTQYLSEYILQNGYSGFIYESALNSGGKNVVLFNPASVRMQNPEAIAITSVHYKISRVESDNELGGTIFVPLND
jgi:hypothetical protein